MTQRDTMPCRHCGGIMILTPTPSPYDFDAVCGCGRYLVSWAHRNDVNLTHEAEDVRRKRDLTEPPPPSRYVPPTAPPPEQLSRRTSTLPKKVIKFG